MMKKFLVTVFALSLTALGCGSDDGGKKDSGVKLDVSPSVEVQPQPDAFVKTDTALPGPEVQADKPADQAQTTEAGPKVDVPAVEVGIDTGKTIDSQPKVDGGTPDAPIGTIDGGSLDTLKGEAAKAIDAGVDSGSAG